MEWKIEAFLQEVNRGRGFISMDNAKILWKLLFDEELNYDAKQELLKLTGRHGNSLISDDRHKHEYFNEDDISFEFDSVYDGGKLLIVVDEQGTVKIARKSKKTTNQYYKEHGDYVYMHTIPHVLLKFIISCKGKFADNLNILRFLPNDVRITFSDLNCKDFDVIATEVFKRPFVKKFYYILFNKGEKISIEKSFSDNDTWKLIDSNLNRDVNSFIYEASTKTLSNTESFSVIITNEKFLISKYNFALSYRDFLFIFSNILLGETLNYLERVWKGELDRAVQVDGSTSTYDETNGQTYYCDPYLLWKENF